VEERSADEGDSEAEGEGEELVAFQGDGGSTAVGVVRVGGVGGRWVEDLTGVCGEVELPGNC
jgi:hypothetical protein